MYREVKDYYDNMDGLHVHRKVTDLTDKEFNHKYFRGTLKSEELPKSLVKKIKYKEHTVRTVCKKVG